MTATCEFSRYDEYDHKQDQEITSAGEDVLLNTEGGGIGLFHHHPAGLFRTQSCVERTVL